MSVFDIESTEEIHVGELVCESNGQRLIISEILDDMVVIEDETRDDTCWIGLYLDKVLPVFLRIQRSTGKDVYIKYREVVFMTLWKEDNIIDFCGLTIRGPENVLFTSDFGIRNLNIFAGNVKMYYERPIENTYIKARTLYIPYLGDYSTFRADCVNMRVYKPSKRISAEKMLENIKFTGVSFNHLCLCNKKFTMQKYMEAHPDVIL